METIYCYLKHLVFSYVTCVYGIITYQEFGTSTICFANITYWEFDTSAMSLWQSYLSKIGYFSCVYGMILRIKNLVHQLCVYINITYQEFGSATMCLWPYYLWRIWYCSYVFMAILHIKNLVSPVLRWQYYLLSDRNLWNMTSKMIFWTEYGNNKLAEEWRKG